MVLLSRFYCNNHNFLYLRTLQRKSFEFHSRHLMCLLYCLALQSWFMIVIFLFCFKFENPLKAFYFVCEYFNCFLHNWMVLNGGVRFPFHYHLFILCSCFPFTVPPIINFTLSNIPLIKLSHRGSSDKRMSRRLSFRFVYMRVCLLSRNREQFQWK